MATYNDPFAGSDSGDLGANWILAYANGLQVISNTARVTNGSDTNGNYYATEMDTGDHEVSIVIGVTGANKYFGVMGRMNGLTGASQRGWVFAVGGTNEIYITERDGATNPDRVVTTGAFTGGDILKIRCVGSAIEGYVGSNLVASWSSSSYNTNKFVGVNMYDSASGTSIDNFSATDVASGSSVAAKAAFYRQMMNS